MWGFAPALSRLGRDLGFTPLVMVGCAVLYGLTLLADPGGIRMGGFSILGPSGPSLLVFGMTGYIPVFEDMRWWTVLTAGWLHGGLLHIGFNMISIRNVSPIVADFYGASRMVIIYIVGSATGFIVTSGVKLLTLTLIGEIPYIGGAYYSVGASAGITALIGAVLYYGHRTGSRGVGDQAKQWIFGFLLMGFLMAGIIDNWAHIGGLGGGYLCAKVLDPLYPERLDHLVIALGLLLLTAVALIASVATALA
jgi:rhomboid protease GluP